MIDDQKIPPTRVLLFLTILSGVLLGFSFPPSPIGVFAVIAFVPLFIVFESIDGYGQAFRFFYLWLLTVHLIVLYWAGGFTHGKDTYLMIAGAMLIIAHPFFYFPAIWVYIFFRRQFGFKLSIFLFPFLWVGIEYVRSLWEIAFPWLTIGNTQSYDLLAIQFVSFTGVYGLSFWLLWLNVLAYALYAKLALGEWKTLSFRSMGMILVIFLVYILPKIYGRAILKEYDAEPKGKSVRIGVVQPNIDPFEKWSEHADEQIEILHRLTNEIANQKPEIILWPETATPFYVLSADNRLYFDRVRRQVDSLEINLFTGIPDIKYYFDDQQTPKSSKVSVGGIRYDTYNSSMLLQPHSNEIQKYAKIILVPFAERVPYSEQMSFLNAMQWNFGLGGWGIGTDTTVFRFVGKKITEVKFSNLICYESIYPGFVASFVRKGAQFLTVITNDSWWENTSGAYQHEQYAVLRAVENHRWVVRCANGGISCFIDPVGHIVKETRLFTQAIITQDVEPMKDLTFYSRHGDWLAESCLIVTLFAITAGIGKKFYFIIRSRDTHEIH
jgi:apolipoprotein N-acyltransferase